VGVIASLKATGHGPVVAADFSPGRRALAERVGADVVIDPNESSPYAAWSDLAGPALPASPLIEVEARPNTVVFECVGVRGLDEVAGAFADLHQPEVHCKILLTPGT
jgi:threonine dehydrogenase-like Zn-dependent dehydrogenase